MASLSLQNFFVRNLLFSDQSWVLWALKTNMSDLVFTLDTLRKYSFCCGLLNIQNNLKASENQSSLSWNTWAIVAFFKTVLTMSSVTALKTTSLATLMMTVVTSTTTPEVKFSRRNFGPPVLPSPAQSSQVRYLPQGQLFEPPGTRVQFLALEEASRYD